MNRPESTVLREVLSHELSRGNEIAEVQTEWSRMDAVYAMRRPIDEDYAAGAAAASPSANVFRTTDPHYAGSQFGIVDGAEAISGPSAEQAPPD